MQLVSMGQDCGTSLELDVKGSTLPGTGLSGRSITCHGQYTAIGLSSYLTPFIQRLCSALGMSLVTSRKTPVRFLSKLVEHDLRTVFGRTLNNIKSECQIASNEELTTLEVKQKMKYAAMPLGECWRTGVLGELLQVRKSQAVLGNFDQEEIDKMIDYLCTE